MKFKPVYFIGIIISLVILALDFYYFFDTRYFYAVVILALTIGWIQFWIDFLTENKRQKEIELQFLEFIRNLSESVKSGISIPRSIIHVSTKQYGPLTPYIKKLANQIEWGIPTRRALITFSLDTNNKIIKRAVSIIIEAEQSGGDIRDILTSVVESVVSVKKMREERRSSVFSQTIQGYIVFYIFIAIMLVLQLWLFPKLGGLSGNLQSSLSGIGGLAGSNSSLDLDRTFFSLIMIQGFFAGIMIGKFSEGTLKNGLIHSLILVTTSALIITTIKGTI